MEHCSVGPAVSRYNSTTCVNIGDHAWPQFDSAIDVDVECIAEGILNVASRAAEATDWRSIEQH